MDLIMSVLGVVVSAVLTFVFAVWMLNIQKRKNHEQDEAEQDRLNAEREKYQAEVWRMVNDELRGELNRYKGERTLLISKYQQLEKDFVDARLEWQKKEAFYDATISQQNERILELQVELKKVKKTTDDLERKTGPIPTQKREPPKS